MAHEDRYGLPLSTTSDAAASAYRDGVDLMLSGWTGTAEALERAIATDPDFALAHIARARVHAFYQQGDLARGKAAIARELVAKRGTERERSHVETLALAIAGRLPEAIAATRKHVETWPRDALVLSLPLGAFGLFAFSGMADHDRARHELCESVAQHYGEDWWFLTMYGWAMTEDGDVARGRGSPSAASDCAGRTPMPRMPCCMRCSRTARSRRPIVSLTTGSRVTTGPEFCTVTSAGTRRSARWSTAMQPGRCRSMPTCSSRR